MMGSRRLVQLALLTALAIVLGMVESLFSPVFPVPGVKLGLANIVTMFALFEFGVMSSLIVVFLKSLFVFVTRGLVALSLSLSGGLAAVAVVYLLMTVLKDHIGVMLMSTAGAVIHNMTQLMVVWLLYDMNVIRYYAPLLIVSGVISGMLNALLFQAASPLIRRGM